VETVLFEESPFDEVREADVGDQTQGFVGYFLAINAYLFRLILIFYLLNLLGELTKHRFLVLFHHLLSYLTFVHDLLPFQSKFLCLLQLYLYQVVGQLLLFLLDQGDLLNQRFGEQASDAGVQQSAEKVFWLLVLPVPKVDLEYLLRYCLQEGTGDRVIWLVHLVNQLH
jgi:hypothetical protein